MVAEDHVRLINMVAKQGWDSVAFINTTAILIKATGFEVLFATVLIKVAWISAAFFATPN